MDPPRGPRFLEEKGPCEVVRGVGEKGRVVFLSDIEVVVDEKEFSAARAPQQRKLREYAGRLQEEPFLGDRIRRRQMPKRFRDLPNLFRLELPEGLRALYTMASSPTAGTQVRIVWVGDHKRYDRLLGYG